MLTIGQKIVITGVPEALRTDASDMLKPGTRGYVCGIGIASTGFLWNPIWKTVFITILTLNKGHSRQFNCKYRWVPLEVYKSKKSKDATKLASIALEYPTETQTTGKELLVRFAALTGYNNHSWLGCLSRVLDRPDAPSQLKSKLLSQAERHLLLNLLLNNNYMSIVLRPCLYDPVRSVREVHIANYIENHRKEITTFINNVRPHIHTYFKSKGVLTELALALNTAPKRLSKLYKFERR